MTEISRKEEVTPLWPRAKVLASAIALSLLSACSVNVVWIRDKDFQPSASSSFSDKEERRYQKYLEDQAMDAYELQQLGAEFIDTTDYATKHQLLVKYYKELVRTQQPVGFSIQSVINQLYHQRGQRWNTNAENYYIYSMLKILERMQARFQRTKNDLIIRWPPLPGEEDYYRSYDDLYLDGRKPPVFWLPPGN